MSLSLSSCKESNEKLTERGVIYIRQGQYSEAIKVFSAIITRNDKLQIPYYNRALCYAELNDLDRALDDLNTVISLHGAAMEGKSESNTLFSEEEDRAQVSITEALYERGQILYKLDSLDKANKDFTGLISSNYEKSSCFLWLGLIWIKQGNESKACEMFNQAKHFALTEQEKEEAKRFITDNCN